MGARWTWGAGVSVVALVAGFLVGSMVVIAPSTGAVSFEEDQVLLVEPNGRWHIRVPGSADYTFWYGIAGDVPLFGDWDGDGYDTPGMYRASNGFAYLTNDLPADGGVGFGDPALTFFFGIPGDQVFVGDWDDDGIDTLGISRNGKMYLANTNATVIADREFWFGTPTDTAFGGDADRDLKDSVFLYRPTSGFTYYTNSTPVGPGDVAPTDGTLFFGVPTDRFVIGDWDADGVDSVGVFRPANTTVYLRNSNTTGGHDISYTFGQPTWQPVAGVPPDPLRVLGSFGVGSGEADALVAELAALHGNVVSYEQFDPESLEERLQLNPPDLIVAEPGRLRGLADYLVDLNGVGLRQDFGDYLIDQGTVDGAVVGGPIKINPKSLVWYKPAEFAAHGYQIPETFAELVALSDEMVADGEIPWCNYINSDAATGWVGTDWVEDLLLGAEGPVVYDQWVGHTVTFSDPRVKTAFERYQLMIDTPGYVFDRANMLSIRFSENAAPLNAGDCLMHRQASFFAAFIGSSGSDLAEFSTFKFPSVAPAFDDAVFGGFDPYVAVVSDDPDVLNLAKAMLKPEFGETALAASGWLLPNTQFDTSLYPDDLTRSWGELTQAALLADQFRFDGSDHMPAEVGFGTFWQGIVDLVSGSKTVPQLLSDIDASWPS